METYNVIWKTLGRGPSDSLPIGNGDIGLNVWVEKDGQLCFYIGKTDAWSENHRLLKVGRVRVELTPNPFHDAKAFRQTLELERGEIRIESGRPDDDVALHL